MIYEYFMIWEKTLKKYFAPIIMDDMRNNILYYSINTY